MRFRAFGLPVAVPPCFWKGKGLGAAGSQGRAVGGVTLTDLISWIYLKFKDSARVEMVGSYL